MTFGATRSVRSQRVDEDGSSAQTSSSRARCIRSRAGSHASRRERSAPAPARLLTAAGLGLIGSGVFVTDAIGGFPESPATGARQPSREGALHDLCAIPIFVGIPAGAGLRSRLRLAGLQRMGALLAGLRPSDRDDLRALQRRIRPGARSDRVGRPLSARSTATGFGWLTAPSMRARCMLASPRLIDAAGGVPRVPSRVPRKTGRSLVLPGSWFRQPTWSRGSPGDIEAVLGAMTEDVGGSSGPSWSRRVEPAAIHAPPDGASRSTSTTSCVISMARCWAKGASCTCLSSGAPGCLESRPSR